MRELRSATSPVPAFYLAQSLWTKPALGTNGRSHRETGQSPPAPRVLTKRCLAAREAPVAYALMASVSPNTPRVGLLYPAAERWPSFWWAHSIRWTLHYSSVSNRPLPCVSSPVARLKTERVAPRWPVSTMPHFSRVPSFSATPYILVLPSP